MYGPTESTCGATIKRLSAGEKVSIGYPNPSTRVYVLDRNRQLMPPGTVGEIYTAGVQVSQGYLGQPEQTQQKFSIDSVLSDPNERMYQTGDLGFWDVITNELHCKGRRDRQIKLRGFRLDLQNLEVRIARVIPESDDVVVYCEEDVLIAVLRPASIDISSVRKRVLQELPGYAAPRRIIAVDSFPLTAAGKLDYARLGSMQTKAVIEPGLKSLTTTERAIARVWRQILQLGPETEILSHSDFVAQGGHSLLQIKLANLLARKFDRSISTKIIIENTVLENLAAAVDALTCGSVSRQLTAGLPLGPHDLSRVEQEWLEKYNMRLGSTAFNVARVYELDPAIVDL
jgi:hypothetical protein